jgi:hypothetical protein
MGSINDLHFIKKYRHLIKGPILEVENKDYGNTQQLRSLFPSFKYIGVDLEKGKGVNLVLDLTKRFDFINKKLGKIKFKTIICLSVLEHCKNPFLLANNCTKLLTPKGHLFINAPFSWRIHAYPDDYWRFTPSGIKLLFSKLDFYQHKGYVTSVNGNKISLNDDLFRAELTILKGLKRKKYGLLTGFFIYFCRKAKILPSVFSHPYLYPPVMINMVGKKYKK